MASNPTPSPPMVTTPRSLHPSTWPNPFQTGFCILCSFLAAVPLRRHYDRSGGGYNFYGGVRSHALVVRIISAVYNYDYLYDVLLYLDGTIETKVMAFG